MKGTVRLVLALGAVFCAIAPVAQALSVAVDPATGRIAVLDGADLPPRIYDLAGRPLPPPQVFNASANATLYVTSALPPGVYRVVSNTTETVLAVVQPRSTSSGEDARTARALANLTQATNDLARVVKASVANETATHAALLSGVDSLARNATQAASDVRAARAAAEAVRIPNDLPRRSDVENGVRAATGRLGQELATQRILTLTAIALAAANLTLLAVAFFVQRRRTQSSARPFAGVSDARPSPMTTALIRRAAPTVTDPQRSTAAALKDAASEAHTLRPPAPENHSVGCEVA